MAASRPQTESLADFRARRLRQATGPRGAVSLQWGAFVTETDERVEGAPGRWSPLPGGRPGLLVRASAAEGIRIGDAIVDGEAVLHHGTAGGPAIAEFPDGAEGVVFTYDGSRYALQVWNQRSEWAQRFHHISAFDEDPRWIVEAEVTPTRDGRTVAIGHHRDPRPVEVPVVAEVDFVWDDVIHRLLATSASSARGRLIVAFRDATNGVESYGAGRTLPFACDLDDGLAVLDFNRAQLLPCAFSTAWNCPLPPAENMLPFPVRAGERNAVDTDGEPLL